MIKATSALIAAVAALALSGGAYAQAGGGSTGGSSAGSTASPANQGVTAKTIARIERSEVGKPHGKTLQIIAQRLGVNADQIESY